jgi:hypothetical protein
MIKCKNCNEIISPKNSQSEGRKRTKYCSKECTKEYYTKTNRYYKKTEGWGEAHHDSLREKQNRKNDYETAILDGYIDYRILGEKWGLDKSTIHTRIRKVLDEADSRKVHDGSAGMQGWKRFISPEGVKKLEDYNSELAQKKESAELKTTEIENRRIERNNRIENKKKEKERKRIERVKKAEMRAAEKARKAAERERKKLLLAQRTKEYAKEYAKEYYDRVKITPEYKRKVAAYRRKEREDPKVRLRSSIGVNVSHALKRRNATKNGGKTFSKLPYTPEQLFTHIESQFDEHMTWDNYGPYWALDHIIPQAALPYDNMDHSNFVKCWALENLQPLERGENARKSSFYEGKKYSWK